MMNNIEFGLTVLSTFVLYAIVGTVIELLVGAARGKR